MAFSDFVAKNICLIDLILPCNIYALADMFCLVICQVLYVIYLIIVILYTRPSWKSAMQLLRLACFE